MTDDLSVDNVARERICCDEAAEAFNVNQEKHFDYYQSQRGQMPDIAGGRA